MEIGNQDLVINRTTKGSPGPRNDDIVEIGNQDLVTERTAKGSPGPRNDDVGVSPRGRNKRVKGGLDEAGVLLDHPGDVTPPHSHVTLYPTTPSRAQLLPSYVPNEDQHVAKQQGSGLLGAACSRENTRDVAAIWHVPVSCGLHGYTLDSACVCWQWPVPQ